MTYRVFCASCWCLFPTCHEPAVPRKVLCEEHLLNAWVIEFLMGSDEWIDLRQMAPYSERKRPLGRPAA